MDKKWLVVIAYTLLILVTLPFARQLWDIVGERNGFFAIIGLYTASIICVRDIRFIGLLVVIAIIIFKLIPLPIERIHFIEYGVLGWLSYWAFGRKAFIYVITVGIIDELIQGALPNRFFDTRDILMNIIGGGLGIAMRLYERKG